jgi:vacuolar protein sorting-associated protein 13A/C
VPPADQPLVRVDRFGCLWSSHSLPDCPGTAGASYATAGAGGVDVVGSDKGVTLWRPQPPVGYAILGDVLSSGGWVQRMPPKMGCLTAIVAFRLASCGCGLFWPLWGAAAHAFSASCLTALALLPSFAIAVLLQATASLTTRWWQWPSTVASSPTQLASA